MSTTCSSILYAACQKYVALFFPPQNCSVMSTFMHLPKLNLIPLQIAVFRFGHYTKKCKNLHMDISEMRNDRLRINSVEICAVVHFKTCRLSTFHWILRQNSEFRMKKYRTHLMELKKCAWGRKYII